MIKNVLVLLIVLAAFGCNTTSNNQNTELTEEEIQETKSVEDMVKSDSLKMDSLKRALGVD